ncbi:histidine phosphatase family protein [Vagococcus acidifermentans]|uniref:Histidine phosphatase family protein n=1 Tax=Vagococcus acidifermentans TaxID=564710 RepID=A0A430AWK9_9ENTE|nr:histidine phosphatase family protein [Vagococcus acidifermentans]RSU12435.1 hypothetical protein CBF27_05515 [Vagococcus acidifermentans]
MELYFTRHGRTQWNQEARFQGRDGDSPLLPESYLAIEALGERCRALSFEAVYASPLKRARDTAAGIVAYQDPRPPIIYDDGLREIGMGQLEGQLIAEARKLYQPELDALRHRPDRFNPERFGGEDYQAMLSRSLSVIRRACANAEKGPLLFVSHGVTLTGAIQTLVGKPLSDVRKMGGLENNTLSQVTIDADGKATLVLWNDASHLRMISQKSR